MRSTGRGSSILCSKATASRSASSARRPSSAIPTRSRAIRYDPAKAKALLKEAGAEGAKLEFLTSPAYDQTQVQAIQQMLNDVGLDTQIVMLRPGDLPQAPRRAIRPNAGSVAIGRWSCACQDADGIIYPLFRTGSTWAKYSNPKFDALVDDARSTLDKKKRHAGLSQGLRDPARGRARHRPLSGLCDLRRKLPSSVEADRQRVHVRRPT